MRTREALLRPRPGVYPHPLRLHGEKDNTSQVCKESGNPRGHPKTPTRPLPVRTDQGRENRTGPDRPHQGAVRGAVQGPMSPIVPFPQAPKPGGSCLSPFLTRTELPRHVLKATPDLPPMQARRHSGSGAGAAFITTYEHDTRQRPTDRTPCPKPGTPCVPCKARDLKTCCALFFPEEGGRGNTRHRQGHGLFLQGPVAACLFAIPQGPAGSAPLPGRQRSRCLSCPDAQTFWRAGVVTLDLTGRRQERPARTRDKTKRKAPADQPDLAFCLGPDWHHDPGTLLERRTCTCCAPASHPRAVDQTMFPKIPSKDRL